MTPVTPPLFSVLMPTFRQRPFIRRALTSLFAQTFSDWELVLIDDGSPDGTAEEIEDFLADSRVSYFRNEKNVGLGAALNQATAYARGKYIAYLPSDDVYFREHLATLADVLEKDTETYLAYSGVQKGHSSISADDGNWFRAATLQGSSVIGREFDALSHVDRVPWSQSLKSGNILALVQVAHRRELEQHVAWLSRTERVSDALEADFWRALLKAGAKFQFTGEITCQWIQHPNQHHRIISGRANEYGRMAGGLGAYRQYYGLAEGEYIDWAPTAGFPVNEWERVEPIFAEPDASAPARVSESLSHREPKLRVLVVGDLGFHPERLLVLQREGVDIAGLWTPNPEVWMVTGPFPFGDFVNIDPDGNWIEAVRQFAPDVIYAGQNWGSLPIISKVHESRLGIPLVLHFKESHGYAYDHGLWPKLYEILVESDALIFANSEARRWYNSATGGRINSKSNPYMILDGDLPVAAWFKGDRQPKISDLDGEVHTVCSGRWLAPGIWKELADEGIHVHIYGQAFHELPSDAVAYAAQDEFLHFHDMCPPQSWVQEFSQYDAGWLHSFASHNHGDINAMTWSDFNIPGRTAVYAAAGLPWILRNNSDGLSQTYVDSCARNLGVGIFYETVPELAAILRSAPALQQRQDSMWASREDFAFDAHARKLVDFLGRVAVRHLT